MKRWIFTAIGIIVVVAAGLWLLRPQINEYLAQWQAIKSRIVNHLPADVLAALENDEDLILFSIDPSVAPVASSPGRTFHDWVVLGQTTVPARQQRQKLAEQIKKGMAHWGGRYGTSCFEPRHAVRATDGVRTFDVLICFGCGYLYYYPPDGRELKLHISTKPGLFDELLISANVPRPPQPGRRP